jgi:AhpD family alkylhydroperoxidase
MPRVTPLPSSSLPPEIAAVYEQFAGGYADFGDQAAALAHVPPALDHLYRMLLALRERRAVPYRYIELAIVTVSKINACPYCVAHHAPLLGVEGVPAEAIARLPEWDHGSFDAVDRLVIEYTGLVTRTAWRIPDAMFERLRAHFSESQIVELTLRIALTGFFNRFNEALQIDDGRHHAGLAASSDGGANGGLGAIT